MNRAVLLLFVALSISAAGAAQTADDTSSVIAEVASHLQREQARSDSLRKAACTTGTPSLCRSAARIEHIIWYVREDLALAVSLAEQVGALAKHVDGTTLPPCPWGGVLEASLRGYATELELKFAGDSAVVRLSRKCDNPPGYLHDIYMLWHDFTLERQRGRWIIKAAGIGVT